MPSFPPRNFACFFPVLLPFLWDNPRFFAAFQRPSPLVWGALAPDFLCIPNKIESFPASFRKFVALFPVKISMLPKILLCMTAVCQTHSQAIPPLNRKWARRKPCPLPAPPVMILILYQILPQKKTLSSYFLKNE